MPVSGPHFTSVRDVEKRLELRERWTEQPKPEPPFDRPSDTNTVDDLPMLYELIALALQTDSTRVATLEIGGSFLPQHLGIKRGYHSMAVNQRQLADEAPGQHGDQHQDRVKHGELAALNSQH